MASVMTVLANGTGGASSVSSANTSSSLVQPNGVEQRLAVFNSKSGTPTLPTITAGGTWAQVKTVVGSTLRITTFRRTGGGETGAITIDFGGVTQDQVQWAVSQITEVTTGAGSSVQSVTGGPTTNSTPTATLATLTDATNNPVYFVCFNGWGVEPTVGSGYTKVHNRQGASGTLYGEYKSPGTTNPSCVFGNGAQTWVAIAEELDSNSSSTYNETETEGGVLADTQSAEIVGPPTVEGGIVGDSFSGDVISGGSGGGGSPDKYYRKYRPGKF